MEIILLLEVVVCDNVLYKVGCELSHEVIMKTSL
jgi:hypothetical protein